MFNECLIATWQTLYMTLTSLLIATIIGLPCGVLLCVTNHKGLVPKRWFYQSFAMIMNAGRSIPFIILLIALIPFSRFVVGTSIGTTAAIVPLTVGAIPFIARIVESALSERAAPLQETGLALGASTWQIVRNILLPEAMPGIIRGLTLTAIALVGYSAMAGAIGGGGLGDLAIRYGYQRFDVRVMLITIIILIVMVQLLQWIGDKWVQKWEKPS